MADWRCQRTAQKDHLGSELSSLELLAWPPTAAVLLAGQRRPNLATAPFISRNWRGKPLVSHQIIVQLINATTTTGAWQGVACTSAQAGSVCKLRRQIKSDAGRCEVIQSCPHP
jgi:hypothetical protein